MGEPKPIGEWTYVDIRGNVWREVDAEPVRWESFDSHVYLHADDGGCFEFWGAIPAKTLLAITARAQEVLEMRGRE